MNTGLLTPPNSTSNPFEKKGSINLDTGQGKKCPSTCAIPMQASTSAGNCYMPNDFDLDTKYFEDVIRQTDNLADRMDEVKRSLENRKNELTDSWVGRGRNTYEMKFRVLMQQLEDLTTNLHEIADSMVIMEEAYIQADTDIAKTLEGKQSRY